MKRFVIFILFCSVFVLSALEQPFRWTGEVQGNRLTVTAVVPEGYYFYRSTLVFDVQALDGKVLRPVKFPSGTVIADDMFGKVEVYGKGSWQWIF